MSSLKWIIPIVIVAILVGIGAYTIYKAQTGNVEIGEVENEATTSAGFGEITSPSPTPKSSPQTQAATVNNQPATGPEDELLVKNAGIQVINPTSGQLISSPLKVSGTANVTSQTVVIKIKTTDGKVLGEGSAQACVGLDACPFEASVVFDKPQTSIGLLEIYSPSTVDNSPTYLQSVPVSF